MSSPNDVPTNMYQCPALRGVQLDCWTNTSPQNRCIRGLLPPHKLYFTHHYSYDYLKNKEILLVCPWSQPCQNVLFQNSPRERSGLFKTPLNRQGSAAPATRLHQTTLWKAGKHTRVVPAGWEEVVSIHRGKTRRCEQRCGSRGLPPGAENGRSPVAGPLHFPACCSRSPALQPLTEGGAGGSGAPAQLRETGSGRQPKEATARTINRHGESSALGRARSTRG